MSNLSFEELETLAESTADTAILEQVSGGTENDCHDDSGGGLFYDIGYAVGEFLGDLFD